MEIAADLIDAQVDFRAAVRRGGDDDDHHHSNFLYTSGWWGKLGSELPAVKVGKLGGWKVEMRGQISCTEQLLVSRWEAVPYKQISRLHVG